MQRTKGQKNRGETRQASTGSVLREMKRGFGLYVPLWSKMEDNKEHCARQAREPSSTEKTEWGFGLYFPQSRERVGEGKWVRATERGKEHSLIWTEQDRPVEKATPRGENCAFSICGSEGLMPLRSPFSCSRGTCGCLKRVVLVWNEKNQSQSVCTVIDHSFNLSVV